MPVRSSTSRVLAWPDRKAVEAALRAWVEAHARVLPNLTRFGYFGSYARGDWGVGSDLDLVALVSASQVPFEQRALAFDVSLLPVPAEIVVYTLEEWDRLRAEGSQFLRRVAEETVWVWTR